MFVSDVSDFKFVGKVKPAFFIAKEEVQNSEFIIKKAKIFSTLHMYYLNSKEVKLFSLFTPSGQVCACLQKKSDKVW